MQYMTGKFGIFFTIITYPDSVWLLINSICMITNKVVASYNVCPTKSYKYFIDEIGTLSEYERLFILERKRLKEDYLSKIQDRLYENRDVSSVLKMPGFIREITISHDDFRAYFDLIEITEKKELIPTVFSEYDKISKSRRIELQWQKLLLEKNGFKVNKGCIVSANRKVKISLNTGKNLLPPILQNIEDFRKQSPRLVLNRHCQICEFRDQCHKEAETSDDLSLIDRISRKQITQFEKKGIFTVNQLSYTYKRRKRSKKLRENYLFKPELQALSIRTKKVFIQKVPELSESKYELYFDIEGISELQDFYLFGVLISSEAKEEYRYFFCKNTTEEVELWKWFLKVISNYPDYPIYHYGEYELRVVKKLAKKYDTDISKIINRFVNVNSFIYGKVYFPVYSNSLKDICHHLDFHWRTPEATGIQSIVWRKKWLSSGDDIYFKKLIQYNEDDCRGLKVLKDYLDKIKDHGANLSEIDYIKNPKDHSTDKSKEIQSKLKLVLKSSYHYYKNTRISFTNSDEKQKEAKRRGIKEGYQGQRRKNPKPTKTITVAPDTTCYKHPNFKLRTIDKTVKRLVIDLKLTRNGIRKEIVEYTGPFGYCEKCARMHSPKAIRDIPKCSLYGHGIKAYVVYNRIALRTPYEKIGSLMNEQFNETVNWGYIVRYILQLAEYYQDTKTQIVNKLLESKVIHADETPLNLRGETQYAWIFTDGQYAYFKLGKTREASLAKDFLKDFTGTLVTDFYTGYDAIDCPQQKCWVHLIRDINSDLRKNPFDAELEQLIFHLKEVIVPIMESVQRFGLKKRFLRKHQKQVDRFYAKMIDDRYYKSENATKYQKRLAKYRNALFTFLHDDDIPWHNNQAERGVRHLTRQMAISGTLHESHTPAYLTLLSIMQTCRFQGKSFFKFLFSENKDLESFRVKER